MNHIVAINSKQIKGNDGSILTKYIAVTNDGSFWETSIYLEPESWKDWSDTKWIKTKHLNIEESKENE